MNPPLNEKKHKQIINRAENNFWSTLKDYFCPCLLTKSTAPLQHSNLKNELIQTLSIKSNLDSELTQKQMRGDVAKMQILRNKQKVRRGSYVLRQSKEQSQQKQEQIQSQWRSQNSYRGTTELQQIRKNRVKFKDQMQWTIWNLNQNQLTIVGSNNHSMLVRVDPVELKPNFNKLKLIANRSQTKFSLTSRSQKTKDTTFKNYEFDRFWQDRYMFFDKFDQGIKIDEQSWSTLPPECVSEYIASKFIGRRSVLDAFAGVGAVSIKLATINSFEKVVSNEPNRQKLSFLLNNATIYEVQSYFQLSNQEFLKIQKGNYDSIFVQPPLANLQVKGSKGISLNDFSPSLDEIIKKSMNLSNNMILLLPPQTNIEQVCSSISKWGSKLKWMKDFCSASIQKIYWNHQLKFILFSLGKQIQTKTKLNDQLDFIYSKLRNWNQKFFKEKKIVKKIREEHGMIELLNTVQQSQLKKRQFYHLNSKFPRNIPIIQFFYEVILERNLISEDRLNKIKLEQEENYDKKESMACSWGVAQQKQIRISPFTFTQEQKIQESPTMLRQAQLTSSQYSYISYFQSLSKSSRHREELLRRGNTLQSTKGVIIKRNPLSSSLHNEYSRQNTAQISDKQKQATNKTINEQQHQSNSKKRSSQTKQKPEGYSNKRISKQT